MYEKRFHFSFHFLFFLFLTISVNKSLAAKYPSLDVPEDILLHVKEAASSQSPYSGNHSVKQAVDGSMESANWHVPGVHHVEGEFVFEVPETIHYIIFLEPISMKLPCPPCPARLGRTLENSISAAPG